MKTINASNRPFAAVDTGNVIPFPDMRAAHKPRGKSLPQTSGLPLPKAVRRFKDAVMRYVRTAETPGMQRNNRRAAAATAHQPEHPQAPVRTPWQGDMRAVAGLKARVRAASCR